jgi:hypothetical protein
VTFAGSAGETQQVSITLGSDSTVEDNETITISMSNPSNSGVIVTDTATVNITNDDTVGFDLSGTTASVSENGTSSSISVVLMSEPTANVTLALSDNDTSEVVYPTSVIFGSGNWSTSQTITLTGKDDSVDDGNQTTLLTLTPSGGGYSGLSAQTLTVTTTDDDAPYVAITSGHCESNNYDKVTNASTCQTAATSLDYNYSGTTNWSDQPQRCFVNSSNNNVYYNQYNTGNVNVEDNSQSSAYLCAR